ARFFEQAERLVAQSLESVRRGARLEAAAPEQVTAQLLDQLGAGQDLLARLDRAGAGDDDGLRPADDDVADLELRILGPRVARGELVRFLLEVRNDRRRLRLGRFRCGTVSRPCHGFAETRL